MSVPASLPDVELDSTQLVSSWGYTWSTPGGHLLAEVFSAWVKDSFLGQLDDDPLSRFNRFASLDALSDALLLEQLFPRLVLAPRMRVAYLAMNAQGARNPWRVCQVSGRGFLDIVTFDDAASINWALRSRREVLDRLGHIPVKVRVTSEQVFDVCERVFAPRGRGFIELFERSACASVFDGLKVPSGLLGQESCALSKQASLVEFLDSFQVADEVLAVTARTLSGPLKSPADVAKGVEVALDVFGSAKSVPVPDPVPALPARRLRTIRSPGL